VAVSGFFGHDWIPVDNFQLALCRNVVLVVYLKTFSGKQSHVAVVKKNESSGMCQNGGDVAGGEHFAYADANNEGAVFSGDDELIRLFFADYRQTV